MTVREDILRIFPERMRERWRRTAAFGDRLQEIRLRAGRPVLLYMEGRERFLTDGGEVTEQEGQAARMGRAELEELFSYVCSGSPYAYEEEISRGYLTLPGGHRMGLAGETVLEKDGRIRNLKYISGMNIRISHEIKGAADGILPWVYENGRPLDTLILSPPGCGKTTILRDLVRRISDGNRFAAGKTVGVVDERSEIAGTFRGEAQNDVGMRTDVLDGCPKAEGMLLLLRSMSPDVIAVDELGGEEEIRCVRQALRCGCAVLATMHAGSVSEAVSRLTGKEGRDLPGSLKEAGSLFSRYVLLSGKDERKERGKGRSAAIWDGNGKLLWRESC